MNQISQGPMASLRCWSIRGVLCAAVMVLGACGGGGGDSPSTVPTSFTGTATGTVVDTSGNPIAGATVSYSGTPAVSTTTATSGQFTLAGISVGAVSIGNGSPITFQIVPQSGLTKYMTATVNAVPKAQIAAGSTPAVSSTFSLNLGTVQIPAMATAVTGTLRNTSTGAAIANVQLSMAFVATNFTKVASPTGVTINLNPSSVSAVTTAADGSFAFQKVYNDTCVRVNMLDYAISDGDAPACSGTASSTDSNALQFSTVGAVKFQDQIGGELQLNTVSAQAFSSGDTVPPVVSAVENVLDASANPGQLASSVTGVCQTLGDGNLSGGLVIDFSEPMAAGPSAANVKVFSGTLSSPTAQSVQSVQLINNSTQLQICLASALPVPSNVYVEILREALTDQSTPNKNIIVLNSNIGYDSLQTINGAALLVLSLTTTASTF